MILHPKPSQVREAREKLRRPTTSKAVATGSDFRRERRYIVIKISDARRYLTDDMRSRLELLEQLIYLGRLGSGKEPLECVCVEKDWPEYGPTWAAIEARMTSPNDSHEPRA